MTLEEGCVRSRSLACVLLSVTPISAKPGHRRAQEHAWIWDRTSSRLKAPTENAAASSHSTKADYSHLRIGAASVCPNRKPAGGFRSARRSFRKDETWLRLQCGAVSTPGSLFKFSDRGRGPGQPSSFRTPRQVTAQQPSVAVSAAGPEDGCLQTEDTKTKHRSANKIPHQVKGDRRHAFLKVTHLYDKHQAEGLERISASGLAARPLQLPHDL
ncbi:hypothetical protein SKAU_G00047330 [Synaphobranchus kaupii]|uniref:Uncharacterized protein n=1 Tax=Synaphobranchus kaupii TaxID=118154 RepID=A0A9Q1G2A2_SYNKA|nr:hypothetical protein SKAU_G00047330 [Synaphobranchus kaupii]